MCNECMVTIKSNIWWKQKDMDDHFEVQAFKRCCIERTSTVHKKQIENSWSR